MFKPKPLEKVRSNKVNEKNNWTDYEVNIRGHRDLGQQYLKCKFGVEDDTLAFLHILSNGLNDPEEITQAGCGGYSELVAYAR